MEINLTIRVEDADRAAAIINYAQILHQEDIEAPLHQIPYIFAFLSDNLSEYYANILFWKGEDIDDWPKPLYESLDQTIDCLYQLINDLETIPRPVQPTEEQLARLAGFPPGQEAANQNSLGDRP